MASIADDMLRKEGAIAAAAAVMHQQATIMQAHTAWLIKMEDAPGEREPAAPVVKRGRGRPPKQKRLKNQSVQVGSCVL